MKKIKVVLCVLFMLSIQSYAQLLVKGHLESTVMRVTSSGDVGIAIGDATPAATLDIGGDLRIGTVSDEGNSDDISVLVLDGGIVKKRTLTADIWDGDATGSGADGVVTSANFSGSASKTLTLGRSNGLSDLTASFSDRFEANTDNQNLSYTNLNAPTGHYTTHRVDITGGTNATIRDYYDPNTDNQNLYNVLGYDGGDAGGRSAVNVGSLAIGADDANGATLRAVGFVNVEGSQHIHNNLTVAWSGDPASAAYIGTNAQPTNPSGNYKLVVNGPLYVHGGARMCFDGGSKLGIGVPNPTSSLAIANLPSGSEMNITADNTGNLYRDTSSRRYKENIQPLDDDFAKILQLAPRSFIYKDSQLESFGYIAEELDDLGLDNLVIYNEEGDPESIRYDKLSVYLIEIVKDLYSRVN